MDFEKAYKNALQLAKSYYDKGTNEFLDTIFPELAEIKREELRTKLLNAISVSARFMDALKREGIGVEEFRKYFKELEEKSSCCGGEVNDEAYQEQLQIWFDKGKCSGKDEVINNPELYGLTKTDTLERVHGWVARDKYNDPLAGVGLIFHYTRPTRCNGEWSSSTIAMHLSYDMFPDLKWEDDPIEVDLLIVKKDDKKS